MESVLEARARGAFVLVYLRKGSSGQAKNGEERNEIKRPLGRASAYASAHNASRIAPRAPALAR